jgi:hypothetical protein
VVKEQNHVLRVLKFENLKSSIQNLKVEGLLRIVCNMWKVFKRPTCASDFFTENPDFRMAFRRENVYFLEDRLDKSSFFTKKGSFQSNYQMSPA